jgi:hypothetical protein
MTTSSDEEEEEKERGGGGRAALLLLLELRSEPLEAVQKTVSSKRTARLHIPAPTV